MGARVIQGDVFDVLPTLPAGSVDCVVTSPPYWALRSYLPKDHPLKPRELGAEKSPAEYVANMVRVFGLVRDALADHGTVWLNVGDTYNQRGTRQGNRGHTLGSDRLDKHRKGYFAGAADLDTGNLCLIPQRLMIALQDDGWIVRSVVVWHKPAPMPSSVSGWQWRRCRVKVKPQGKSGLKLDTAGIGNFPPWPGNGIEREAASWSDCPGCRKCEKSGGYVLRKGSWRPTSSYEPVIMLAKTADYFADGIPVRTPPKEATVGRDRYTRVLDDPDEQFAVRHDHETVCDGANLRDVWTIPHEPLRDSHYAAYPTALVEKCLRAGTSAKGYCPGCGKPWVRVVEGEKSFASGSGRSGNPSVGKNGLKMQGGGDTGDIRNGPVLSVRTLDWRPSCACPPADPRPGLVLDPFGGSGRTAITAQQLGLDSVSVELNPEYVDMATRLIRDDSPLFSGFSA